MEQFDQSLTVKKQINAVRFTSKKSVYSSLRTLGVFVLGSLLMQNAALADTKVQMNELSKSGIGESIGTISISENKHGVVFTPDLSGLSEGLHGFHVHKNASCETKKVDGKLTPGGAAGGHMDNENAQHHDKPWADGHDGDIPALFVDDNGKAKTPVIAPRLTLKDVNGHALMIHANGDNYADNPKPLGGGGSRVACGVVTL